ncbi:MAG TPA: M4 family metallopeptidase [Thermoanaerobaculia bacterium]|nr:M4 family metallopeptidase [Thermoanaerobaculia bacterium]
MKPHRGALCSIVPPHMLQTLAERGDDDDRRRAIAALEWSLQPRTERAALVMIAGPVILPPLRKRRTVYDARHDRDLPGVIARGEGAPRTRDTAVNEAYDGAGRTYDFFRRVYGRRSVDDHALRIDSSVHFGDGFNNAHWNGRQMIYGDGDGKYFRSFTSALDIIAHELTHGVSQYTAGFAYSGQAGALAEHFSDVFGVLAKQYWSRQSAARADWIVGAGLFTNRVNGDGIRSLKAPGTAYDDPVLGTDPQPDHMRGYVRTAGDDRGVHVNCGIPNHAFYLTATLLGGRAWETAGRIWYHALTRDLGPRAQFRHCADATWRAAGALFGAGSAPQEAVLAAWKTVGIDVSPALVPEGPRLPVRERRIRLDVFEPMTAGAETPHFVS